MRIQIAIFAQSETANHGPAVFPDPYAYVPERWAAEIPAMRASFTTFGAGRPVIVSLVARADIAVCW